MDGNNPAHRLIVKAALRYSNSAVPISTRSVQLIAYSEVAADILGLCLAPEGFRAAIIAALGDTPLDISPGATRESAGGQREEWAVTVVRDVLARLA
jgi:hypothetical protein